MAVTFKDVKKIFKDAGLTFGDTEREAMNAIRGMSRTDWANFSGAEKKDLKEWAKTQKGSVALDALKLAKVVLSGPVRRIMGEKMTVEKASHNRENGVAIELLSNEKSIAILVKDTDANKIVGVKKWKISDRRKAEQYYQKALL